jgi:hypothetical protein
VRREDIFFFFFLLDTKKKPSPMNGVLLHGSPLKLTKLAPRASLLLNNAEVVFATPSRWLALVFCAHTTSLDLDFGFANNTPYVAELRAGAFDLLKVPGYIHTVSAIEFRSDSRLGMRHHEFVNPNTVPVSECEYIPDVYTDLARFEHLKLIPYAAAAPSN